MRITLHAVAADDHPFFHDAMQATLRAARFNDRRFRATGSVHRRRRRAGAGGARVRVAAPDQRRVRRLLRARFGPLPKPGAWWALRSVAPVAHAPTGGAWSFGRRPAYVAAPTRPPAGDREQSVQRLVWRYLEGFGPASVQDVAQFALMHRPTVRAALQALDGTLVRLEGPGGVELFDVPGAFVPDEDTPAPPRLMAMWDSVLLAYADRSRVIPPEYRKLVMRSNGDVLPTLLVDGYVCGVWRPVDGGIEATAFHRLPDDAWDGLAAEARQLVAFLADREPAVYRRYARWWTDLPTADVHLLPA